MHKLSFGVGDAVRGPVTLTASSLLRRGSVRSLVALPAAVQAEVVDHVMKTVKKSGREPQSVQHRVEEAGVAEVTERRDRR